MVHVLLIELILFNHVVYVKHLSKLINKEQYIVQPYHVGTNKQSLAIVIPSPIVKKYKFNPVTTVFTLKVMENTDELLLKDISVISRTGTDSINGEVED